jgi:hypothetical protein
MENNIIKTLGLLMSNIDCLQKEIDDMSSSLPIEKREIIKKEIETLNDEKNKASVKLNEILSKFNQA